METEQSQTSAVSPHRSSLIALAAGVMGFVVNGFGFELFPDVTLIFGGILYLLIASAYGPFYGGLTALVASSRTILLWGGPHAIPGFVLEAVFVGWQVRRGKSLIWSDLAYWTALGIPLLILVFVIRIPDPNVVGTGLVGWVITLKQSLNGLMDAVIAEFLLGTGLVQRIIHYAGHSSERRPLRAHLEKGFILVAAMPLVLLSFIYGRMNLQEDKQEATFRLQETANAVRRNVDDYVKSHLQAITALAGSIEQSGGLRPEDLNRLLARHHANYEGFLTLIAADSEGRLIGAHPLASESGQPMLEMKDSVADREYFRQPKQNGQPFISDVFLGRSFGKDPIVAISAPLKSRDGTFSGICEGSLNLALFNEFGVDYQASQRAEIILLDRSDRVIYATLTSPYKTLQPLSSDPLVEAARRAGGQAFFQEATPVASENDENYLVAQATTHSAGWRVLIRQPEREVNRATERYFIISMLSALIGIVLAIVVVRWTSGRVTRPIEHLVEGLREASLHDGFRRKLVAPPYSPAEVAELIDDLNNMTVRLSNSYDQVQSALREREAVNRSLEEVLSSLDQKVRERTEDLDFARSRAEQAEQRYAELVRGIDPIVWEMDAETMRMIFISRRAEDVLGYTAEQWLSEPGFWLDVIHPQDRNQVLAITRRSIDEGCDYRVEYRAIASDGRQVWLRNNVRVVKDADGRAQQLRGVTVDVTKAKQDEAERQHLEEQLFEARRMESIGTLAGGVAHDFNNLLAAILGNSQLALRRVKGDEKMLAYLSDIEKSAERAASLTQQLLAFSRHQHLYRTKINLNDTVRELVKMLGRIAGDRVEVSFSDRTETSWVYADQSRIEQVMMILAVNARDAMPEGGRIIIETRTVRLDRRFCLERAWARPGSYVQLLFRDTGTGMDLQTRQRIFEPFFTTKAVGKGTGLGLSVVYGIVKQHQGLINVTSNPGRGTTFEIYLPVGEQEEQTAEASNALLVEGGTETILVAERQYALLNLAQSILTRLGYRVLIADDGQKAIDLFASNRNEVSLVLLDAEMSQVEGRDVYDHLRAVGAHTPILFMINCEVEGAPPSSTARADVTVIEKPFGVRELGRKVREALDRGKTSNASV